MQKLGIFWKEMSTFDMLFLFSRAKVSYLDYLTEQSPNLKMSVSSLTCGHTAFAFNWRMMGSSPYEVSIKLYS